MADQLNLFELQRDHYGNVDFKLLARRTDPQTSQESAGGAADRLGKLQRVFLSVLNRRSSPMTAMEVAIEASGGNHAAVESIRKRAKELVDLKLIDSVGVRPCRISGRNATVYSVKGGDR